MSLGDVVLKNNVLALAEEHRKNCAGEECTISLVLLGALLKRAGIELAPDEAEKLW
jgi:hypothetical protein